MLQSFNGFSEASAENIETNDRGALRAALVEATKMHRSCLYAIAAKGNFDEPAAKD